MLERVTLDLREGGDRESEDEDTSTCSVENIEELAEMKATPGFVGRFVCTVNDNFAPTKLVGLSEHISLTGLVSFQIECLGSEVLQN